MSKYLTAVGRKTSFLRGKKNQTSLGEGQPSAMTVWGSGERKRSHEEDVM